jgi:hypothetical protein
MNQTPNLVPRVDTLPVNCALQMAPRVQVGRCEIGRLRGPQLRPVSSCPSNCVSSPKSAYVAGQMSRGSFAHKAHSLLCCQGYWTVHNGYRCYRLFTRTLGLIYERNAILTFISCKNNFYKETFHVKLYENGYIRKGLKRQFSLRTTLQHLQLCTDISELKLKYLPQKDGISRVIIKKMS